MKWISVKNRLPQLGRWVIAYSGNQTEILFKDKT